jgi:hypothetical protein
MKRCIAALAVASLATGCAPDKNPPPPDYSPAWGNDNRVTCDYLRQENPPVDKISRFTVDGGQAGCAVTGLECPMGECDGGIGVAECLMGYWVFACVRILDGGKDAGEVEAAVPTEAGAEAAVDGESEAD